MKPSAGPTYALVEIFESLQGEGRNTGRPCVFVRFAGCNLACPWCDTDVSCRFSATLEELVGEIAAFRAKSVVLTGGEPTLVEGMPELVAELKSRGYWIAVETNGTNDADWLQFVDYVACSPKSEFPDSVALSRADEVRVVASSEEVVGFCRGIRGRIAATDYYVSPCERGGEIDFATAKSVLSQLDGWSLSVQLHKILGFR
jgi:organic radical activating enzyme